MTAKTRIKQVVPAWPAIATRDQLESVTGDIAAAVTERAAATEAMNAAIIEVRQRYESKLSLLDDLIHEQTDQVHDYVRAHPETIPAGRKSVELLHAVIGYRTGMPRVAALKGWSLKKALDACLSRKPSWVRQVPELDRERIIIDLPVGGAAESVGLAVLQDETFFVAPRLDEAESKPTLPANEK